MGGCSCVVVRRPPSAVRRPPLTFVRQRSSGHSSWPIFTKLAQDVHLDSPQAKFETGSDRVKNQVTRSIYRKTALALQRPQIQPNPHQTCSGCSSGHSLGQVRNWVRSGQKAKVSGERSQGPQGPLVYGNVINFYSSIDCIQSFSNFNAFRCCKALKIAIAASLPTSSKCQHRVF